MSVRLARALAFVSAGAVCCAAGAQVTPTATEAPTTAEQPPATTVDVTAEQTAESLGELPTAGFWEGGGVRVTEGTIFHPAFEVSTAYESNVFYQDDADGPDGPIAAAVARFSVGAALGTVTPGRMEIEAPGTENTQRLNFHLEGLLTWNQYISSETVVTDQSDLGIGLNADATFNPNGKLSFGVRDAFIRNVTPGQSLRESADRDRNELSGRLVWKPGGGAIETYLNYTFTVDLFETNVLAYEDRLSHTFALGGKWQWLPRTQFSLEASIGTVTPSNLELKSESTPFRVWAGISTLITPVLGLIARGGYGNGFYKSDESVSTYLALAELRYAIGPTIRTAIGYAHDFADALVGNFYIDHTFFVRGGWQLHERWQLRLAGELRLRSYGGIRDTMDLDLCGDESCGNFRDDTLARLDASVEYQITRWLFGGVSYDLEVDMTDFFVSGGGGRDYGAYVASEALVKLSARF